jgi:adenine-specific DNA-methyltransferase
MDEDSLPITWWDEKGYASANYGASELKELFSEKEFDFPKARQLVLDSLKVAGLKNDNTIALDFFAGSGTTGHAAIQLNREYGGHRKYILVEQGEYFETVTKPRIQKVVYSSDWKDGKATAPQTGMSHAFKVLKLESYEDTLNNLQISDEKERQAAIECSPKLREAYYLNYLLEMETQGSPSLLNVSAFSDPTAYQLNIKSTGSDAQVSQAVDLLETFNWLIGLRVKKLHAPIRFNANLAREADTDLPAGSTTRLCLKGKLQEDPNGTWWFRSVEGLVKNTGGSQREQRVLIVWRKLTGDLEQDNTVLAAYLAEYHIIDVQKPTLEVPFDVIYINGSHNLPMLAQCDIRLLEDTFHQKMWDVKDV